MCRSRLTPHFNRGNPVDDASSVLLARPPSRSPGAKAAAAENQGEFGPTRDSYSSGSRFMVHPISDLYTLLLLLFRGICFPSGKTERSRRSSSRSRERARARRERSAVVLRREQRTMQRTTEATAAEATADWAHAWPASARSRSFNGDAAGEDDGSKTKSTKRRLIANIIIIISSKEIYHVVGLFTLA